MNSTTLERLQEQMQNLKLVRAAAELPTLLQEASKREITYADFLQEAGASHADENSHGPLPVPQDAGEL
jgi:hypothetical protein